MQATIKTRRYNTRRTAEKHAAMLEQSGHYTEIKPHPDGGYVLTFYRRNVNQ